VKVMSEKEAATESSEPRVRHPSWLWLAGYMFFGRLNLLSKFQSLRVVHEERLASVREDVPLIVFANHASWWDAGSLMEVKFHAFPRRTVFYPTESDALRRAPHLAHLGSFPLHLGSVSGTKRFIRDCQHILSLPDTMLVITPEGKFTDPRKRPLELRRGLASLVGKLRTVTVVPLAIEYTLWDEARPEILTCWGEPISIADGTAKSTNEWHALMTESLTQTLDELAAISIQRELWKFCPVLHGRLGPRNLKAMFADFRTLYRYRNRGKR
jgi:1-acyl-sn-glycerol-3-phosphate acyltransferase